MLEQVECHSLGQEKPPTSRNALQNQLPAVHDELASFDATDPNYATQFVDKLLELAQANECSDVHLQPTADGLEIQWRLDGVLQLVGTFSSGEAADVVSRIKVLAELLTYQTDVPQEGRIRIESTDSAQRVEMRVSTLPTVFGERAVIRIFASGELKWLQQLGLPEKMVSQLDAMLRETTGAIIVTGPAGSGKTTTAYACLRHIVDTSSRGRSIVSLEDPVEVVVPGVAQAQVNLSVDFDLLTGLKSMLRQDPEVIFVGEIRDRETAEVATQAALTGQLVITTFHAGSATEALSRLADMGLEPYILRSGLVGIVSQRLVRKLCECAEWNSDDSSNLGLPVEKYRIPIGCDVCKSTGYVGRVVLAELLPIRNEQIGRAILEKQDSTSLERMASSDCGMTTLWQRAVEVVESGLTSPEEIRRVLGVQ